MEAGLRDLRSSRRVPMPQSVEFHSEEESMPNKQEVPEKEEAPKPEEAAPPKPSLMFDFKINQDNLSDAEFEQVKRLREAMSDPKRARSTNITSLMNDIGLTEEEKRIMVKEMQSIPKDKPVHVDNTYQEEFRRLEQVMRDDDGVFPLMEKWTKDVEKALGKSVSDPTQLTEEDFKKIPPVPQKLLDVVKYMMSGKQ